MFSAGALLTVLLAALEPMPTALRPPMPGFSPARPATAATTTLKAVPRLISEHASLVAGEWNTLGVTFEIAPKWHVYWIGQNDSGMPISVEWDVPPGFEVGPVRWPTPQRHLAPGDILDYVYFNRVTLLVTIKPPMTDTSAAPASPAKIAAKLDWLVCDESCIPEAASVSLSLDVVRAASEAARPRGADAKLIEQARLRLARPAPTGALKSTASESGVVLTVPGAQKLTFFPRDDGAAILNAHKGGQADRESLELAVQRDAGGTEPPEVRGILEATFAGKATEFYEIQIPVGRWPTGASEGSPAAAGKR